MKLAYLIMAHKNPAQLERLIGAIHAPDNYYLLHVDRRAEANCHAAAAGLAKQYPEVELLRSRSCRWGGWSQVAVQLAGMKRLLRRADDWSFFINLSGQDFPCWASPRSPSG